MHIDMYIYMFPKVFFKMDVMDLRLPFLHLHPVCSSL